MTTPVYALPVPWGDRSALHRKGMLYALSLDVEATADGPYLILKSSADKKAIRHIFEETIVTMPEGLRCDVPTGAIAGGDGEIGAPHDTQSSNLVLRLKADLGTAGSLLMDCGGVINFDGGPEVFRSRDSRQLTGAAFIATHNETTSATFRWLNRRQLFGFGRVKGKRGPSYQWLLEFSFDLYGAG